MRSGQRASTELRVVYCSQDPPPIWSRWRMRRNRPFTASDGLQFVCALTAGSRSSKMRFTLVARFVAFCHLRSCPPKYPRTSIPSFTSLVLRAMLQQGCPKLARYAGLPQTFRNESDDHSGAERSMVVCDDHHRQLPFRLMGMAPIRDRLLILGSGEIAVGTWPIIPQPSWLIRVLRQNELAEGNRPSARAANGRDSTHKYSRSCVCGSGLQCEIDTAPGKPFWRTATLSISVPVGACLVHTTSSNTPLLRRVPCSSPDAPCSPRGYSAHLVQSPNGHGRHARPTCTGRASGRRLAALLQVRQRDAAYFVGTRSALTGCPNLVVTVGQEDVRRVDHLHRPRLLQNRCPVGLCPHPGTWTHQPIHR